MNQHGGTCSCQACVMSRREKTPCEVSRISSAIRSAVKKDREAIVTKLSRWMSDCLCSGDDAPCGACTQTARVCGVIQGMELP